MLTWNQWIENLKYNGMNQKIKLIDFKIKEQIWERVKARCVDRKRNKVLTELRWYFAVASLALLLTIGGFWMNSVRDNINDEFIMVIAQQKPNARFTGQYKSMDGIR